MILLFGWRLIALKVILNDIWNSCLLLVNHGWKQPPVFISLRVLGEQESNIHVGKMFPPIPRINFCT